MGAAAPDIGGRVRGEGSLALPDLADRLVNQERQGRRAERAGGGEFPLPTTAGSGEKPKSEGRDGDDRDCPFFDRAEPAPKPGIVVDELIDRVVDPIVHGQLGAPNLSTFGVSSSTAALAARCRRRVRSPPSHDDRAFVRERAGEDPSARDDAGRRIDSKDLGQRRPGGATPTDEVERSAEHDKRRMCDRRGQSSDEPDRACGRIDRVDSAALAARSQAAGDVDLAVEPAMPA